MLALGYEVLTPLPGKVDPYGAMGASLVKGRGHKPRTAALTGQGSTSANRGEPGKYPGGGTPRAASQRDYLGEEATVVGGRCAVREEGKEEYKKDP